MSGEIFTCRRSCGACCIAPSINSPFHGMPYGKPAGTPCVHLDDDMSCRLFNDPRRPKFCGLLSPSAEMCGSSQEQALVYLYDLELATD